MNKRRASAWERFGFSSALASADANKSLFANRLSVQGAGHSRRRGHRDRGRAIGRARHRVHKARAMNSTARGLEEQGAAKPTPVARPRDSLRCQRFGAQIGSLAAPAGPRNQSRAEPVRARPRAMLVAGARWTSKLERRGRKPARSNAGRMPSFSKAAENAVPCALVVLLGARAGAADTGRGSARPARTSRTEGRPPTLAVLERWGAGGSAIPATPRRSGRRVSCCADPHSSRSTQPLIAGPSLAFRRRFT